MKRQMIIPESYRKLTPEEKSKICNGAGSSQYGFDFVPDTMYGLNLNIAADIHDYMYFFGISRLDKIIADVVYLHNMFAYIESNSYWFMVWVRENRALSYAMAVNSFGDGSFFIDGKYNTSCRDDLDLIDFINVVGLRLEAIKRFVLISSKKNITFNGNVFDGSRISEYYIDVIELIISKIEEETNEKVISDYEKIFNSYFKKQKTA